MQNSALKVPKQSLTKRDYRLWFGILAAVWIGCARSESEPQPRPSFESSPLHVPQNEFINQAVEFAKTARYASQMIASGRLEVEDVRVINQQMLKSFDAIPERSPSDSKSIAQRLNAALEIFHRIDANAEQWLNDFSFSHKSSSDALLANGEADVASNQLMIATKSIELVAIEIEIEAYGGNEVDNQKREELEGELRQLAGQAGVSSQLSARMKSVLGAEKQRSHNLDE